MCDMKTDLIRSIVSWLTASVRRAGSFRRHAGVVAGVLLGIAASADALAAAVVFPSNGSGILPNLAFSASLASPRNAPVGTVLQSATQAVGLSSNGLTCNVQKAMSVTGTAVAGRCVDVSDERARHRCAFLHNEPLERKLGAGAGYANASRQ